MGVHFDIVAAQGMFVQLKGALDEVARVKGLFMRGSRPRKLEEILDNPGGAAGLPVGQFQLAPGGIIGSRSLAEKFGNSKNGRQGIVQLMSHPGEHLSHGGKFLRLDKLFLEALEIGNVAPGENHAFNIPLFIRKRTEIKANPAPIPQLVAHANLNRPKGLLSAEHIFVERQHLG